MNFEAVFYHALTPLACAFAPFAGSLAAAAVLWRWFRGSWAGVAQEPKAALPFWKDAAVSLLFFTLFYVPVPNPGALIGFEDRDVDLGLTPAGETTVAIFMLERVSYGLDSLIVSALGWDVSMQAILAQEEAYIEDDQRPIRVARRPNQADAVYAFIALRAQFLKKYADLWWERSRLPEQAEAQKQDPGLGFWDLLGALSPDQQWRFVVRQVTAFLYSIGAFLGLAFFYLVFLLFSLILLGLAGVGKYGAVFMFGIVLFLWPFAFFFHGRKALLSVANLLAAFLFLKAAAVVLCWLSFFIIEGVVLQGLIEAMAGDDPVAEAIQRFGPGYLYTEAGSEIVAAAEAAGRAQAGKTAVSQTLMSMLVVLLAMAYAALKLPSVLASLLGVQSLADDLTSSLLFIGGALASMGAALKAKLAAGAAAAANALSKPKSGG